MLLSGRAPLPLDSLVHGPFVFATGLFFPSLEGLTDSPLLLHLCFWSESVFELCEAALHLLHGLLHRVLSLRRGRPSSLADPLLWNVQPTDKPGGMVNLTESKVDGMCLRNGRHCLERSVAPPSW
jgi:hypothetical protein